MTYAATRLAKFKQGWRSGLPETPCGAGSTLARTAKQRAWIPRMVAAHGIRSIADIGAGDLNWSRRITWPAGVHYRAYDLVPRHPTVQRLDLLAEPCPPADLIMCLWVLNHLRREEMVPALAKLRAAGRWLMYTWDERLPPEFDLAPVAQVRLRGRRKRKPAQFIRLVNGERDESIQF